MRSQKSREAAWTGMLFALAIALSFLESAITPLLGLMPAMKLVFPTWWSCTRCFS